jgi:hypothetical protein
MSKMYKQGSGNVDTSQLLTGLRSLEFFFNIPIDCSQVFEISAAMKLLRKCRKTALQIPKETRLSLIEYHMTSNAILSIYTGLHLMEQIDMHIRYLSKLVNIQVQEIREGRARFVGDTEIYCEGLVMLAYSACREKAKEALAILIAGVEEAQKEYMVQDAEGY